MAQKCSEPGFLVNNSALWDDEDALNRNYNYNYYTDLWGGLPFSSSAPATARTSAENSRPKVVAASEAVESDYGRVNNKNNNVSADTQLSCETAATSSSGGSMSSPSKSNEVIKSSKNKVLMGTKDIECQSQKAREDSGENFKQCSTGTSSSKRSRAAEVHNLSEKRRRNRINEKMKALQNLIPNSNKTDKASMLDEAIEYLKKLQLQVQMLSARSGIDLSSMRWLAQMPHLQIQQMPKARMAIDQHAGVPISMPAGSELINTNQGSEKRPLPLHDLYNSGALGNTAIPINLSSVRIDDHHSCKMDHPQGHFTLPQLPTTTQEVHSALSLQEK